MRDGQTTTTNEQVKIELLSQSKLEAEFRNFSGKFFILGVGVWGPLFRKKHRKCVFFGYLPWYLVMDARRIKNLILVVQFSFSSVTVF